MRSAEAQKVCEGRLINRLAGFQREKLPDFVRIVAGPPFGVHFTTLYRYLRKSRN